MSEERQTVLSALKKGKISEEEADKLLDQLEDPQKSSESSSSNTLTKKFLRIRVTDSDDTNVNINIPIALAEVGLKMVPKEKLNVKGQEISIDHILELIEEGTEGELVNVDINDNGKETKVKIYID
jgi:hypothetical protein